MIYKKKFPAIAIMLIVGLLLSFNSKAQETWPPRLLTSNKNGVAALSTVELLKVPAPVQHILDSTSDALLTVANVVPTIELVYHDQLPNASLNGTGWSSWGDICLASDGKVYSGIGNHGLGDSGETYIYCWDPSMKTFRKVADLNKLTGAEPGDVRFSKVHAPIFEGKDKKIYFTGTLNDGDKAGNKEMLGKWNKKIAGGKLFQYDPVSGRTVIYADFPPARVTATMIYDKNRNILYCELEGSPDGVAFGAFDMERKMWIYQSSPGVISHHRNLMLDNQGHVYFNGLQKDLSKTELQAIAIRKNNRRTSMLPADQAGRIVRTPNTQIWKYDPVTNSVSPTQSYTLGGFRASTYETKAGYIYGSTLTGELYKYSPAKDELDLQGSNFLHKGEYITVFVLSPDEKYVYYLPGAHGSAGFSGTPVIQYNIATGRQKALAFLSEPMIKVFKYAPGGTYGLKISNDGANLFIGLNGALPDPLRPEGMRPDFGLTSFAVFHIPAKER